MVERSPIKKDLHQELFSLLLLLCYNGLFLEYFIAFHVAFFVDTLNKKGVAYCTVCLIEYSLHAHMTSSAGKYYRIVLLIAAQLFVVIAKVI